MDVTYDNANRTYIRSNTATAVRFLWFLSALLFVLVVGLCVFVVLGRDDAKNYHWDEAGKFYYTLDGNQATIVKFVDSAAETYTVPASVNYGGKNYAVTTIGAKAFTNHSALTNVIIPDSVTEIVGDNENKTGAFSGCIALTNVKFGQNIARVGGYAFKNCIALTEVELPASVQFIGDGAFLNCVGLKTIGLNSNGIVSDNSFANCLQVETLKLGDNVLLSDTMRQNLGSLTKLSKFEITENHSTYRVQNTGAGECLLDVTNSANPTVVLGGVGAVVPDNVIRILDWAWGSRAVDNLYVPSTVATIGANSFQCAAICTDANEKPNGWRGTVPVYTQAQLVTFVAGDDSTAKAYIYHDAEDEVVYPKYDDLFGNLELSAPFVKWGTLSGTTCNAVYATEYATSLSDLESVMAVTAVYLDDAETRLKFTVGFWNDLKTLYDNAMSITNPATTYQYVLDDLISALQTANNQIAAANDATIMESTDWWVGLQNLIDAVDAVDVADLAVSVDDDLRDKLIETQLTAEFIVANRNYIDTETGVFVWQNLRELYEKLEMNVDGDSHLAHEIEACESLVCTQYTHASWQNLQTHLAKAKQLTIHNLTVSTVRKNLAQARADLREADWNDNLTRLDAWISICSDLPSNDFQPAEYSRLMLEVQTTLANRSGLINNRKVNNAIGNLQNRYANLVPTDNAASYRTENTGILNKKSLPYFITAVILFTGAVAAGAVAGKMQHELRQS